MLCNVEAITGNDTSAAAKCFRRNIQHMKVKHEAAQTCRQTLDYKPCDTSSFRANL